MPNIPAPPIDSELESLKLPPYSLEAEQAVLGGLMLDNGAWDRIADMVTEEDFYRRDHRILFRAIAALAAEDHPRDIITLAEWLDNHGELETLGGINYLNALVRNTPTAANIKSYSTIVHERSVLRQLIEVATHITESAYAPEGRSVSELLDEAEKRVFQIADRGARGREGFTAMRDLLLDAVERVDYLFQLANPITGMPSGFDDFDRMTSGLQRSDLIIVAGRPSMGKTTFAMNLAENGALLGKKPVAVFSMEMPGEQLAMRMMSSHGHIDQHRVRTGRLEEEDWARLTSAVSILSKAPIFIDDTPGLSPTELRARARRLAREQGDLGLIVIDYLQLMQIHGMKENRATEISAISRSLKGLAKELQVPVVALSQLNRSLEQRPNKRPVMSDLRESGAIEQDADVIIFIYRDEVYNPESSDKGTAEVIIGKQRNGPIGSIRLAWHGAYTRFENFADSKRYPNIDGDQ